MRISMVRGAVLLLMVVGLLAVAVAEAPFRYEDLSGYDVVINVSSGYKWYETQNATLSDYPGRVFDLVVVDLNGDGSGAEVVLEGADGPFVLSVNDTLMNATGQAKETSGKMSHCGIDGQLERGAKGVTHMVTFSLGEGVIIVKSPKSFDQLNQSLALVSWEKIGAKDESAPSSFFYV